MLKDSKYMRTFGRVSELSMIQPDLVRANKELDGINFTLVMRDSKDNLALYRRGSQPCYGELRKYKSTHGDECTQPKNHKPGDLHDPFPDGTPEALAIGWSPFNGIPKEGALKELIDYVWSDASPWVKGFGGKSNIIIDQHGVILKDLKIDPTVLINLLKCMQGWCAYQKHDIIKLSNLGLPINKIAGFYLAVRHGGGLLFPEVDNYTYPQRFSVRRFVDQNPVDLTGGTLADRFDYNRTDLSKVFHDPKEVPFSLKVHQALGGDGAKRMKVPLERVVEVFDAEWENRLMIKKELAA